MKLHLPLTLLLIGQDVVRAFVSPHSDASAQNKLFTAKEDLQGITFGTDRRASFEILVGGLTGLPLAAVAEENIFAPKFVQEYSDFQMTGEGWSYRDVKVGEGENPNVGDRVARFGI